MLKNCDIFLREENQKNLQDDFLNATLSFELGLRKDEHSGNMTEGVGVVDGIDAMRLAKEISKLPDGCFTICFYPYSRARGIASRKLVVRERCKFRAQLPQERFDVDSENYFLFSDADGKPKMCYRILIRFMGFPHDNFKLHKIKWL